MQHAAKLQPTRHAPENAKQVPHGSIIIDGAGRIHLFGPPHPEGHHNCDQMGCGTLTPHHLAFFDLSKLSKAIDLLHTYGEGQDVPSEVNGEVLGLLFDVARSANGGQLPNTTTPHHQG